MAPEIEQNDAPISLESNVFAFGVCIWEALTLELPWKELEKGAIRANLRDNKRPERPASMADAEWELISE
ncbi:Serine/threonine protein kinase, partial [Globisporangium polare]